MSASLGVLTVPVCFYHGAPWLASTLMLLSIVCLLLAIWMPTLVRASQLNKLDPEEDA
jgi:hypothetical protein